MEESLEDGLIYSSGSGDLEEVKLFLERGADVNASNWSGWTPLLRAAVKGNVKVVKLLVASGADLEAKDSAGETSLMLATSRRHVQVVEFLLRRGASIETKSNSGLTAVEFTKGNYSDVKNPHISANNHLYATGSSRTMVKKNP
mmetsp:Transcript_11638/g.32711  ORF Transcript_11638/g.32711 Transcript_11638/m.32711 type:complete len:144 (+) Transcript_11638:29-460(+)